MEDHGRRIGANTEGASNNNGYGRLPDNNRGTDGYGNQGGPGGYHNRPGGPKSPSYNIHYNNRN